MRKTILALLLTIVASSSAAAEWVKVGVSDTYNNVYFDSATLNRDGNLAQLSTLLDFGVTQDSDGVAFRSLDTRFQFDCKKKH